MSTGYFDAASQALKRKASTNAPHSLTEDE
jgi:hypothetical protein